MSSRRLRLIAPVLVAAVMLGGAAAASADAPVAPRVWVGQAGTETELHFVSGCFSSLEPDGTGLALCADGVLVPGPDLALAAGAPLQVRIDRPASEVGAAIAPSGRETQTDLPVTPGADATLWQATLPANLYDGSRLSVFARGATPATWDVAAVGTIAAPAVAPTGPAPVPKPVRTPHITIARLKVAGRTVRGALRMTQPVGASFSAVVVLGRHHVSSRLTDGLMDGDGTFHLTLDRRTASQARRHGVLVIRAIPWSGGTGLIRLTRPLSR